MDRILKYIEEFPLFIIELRIKRSQLTETEYWYFDQGNGRYINSVRCLTHRGETLVKLIPDNV